MGFLFASGNKKKVPDITGLQIQTAVNILPIPIIYGGPRCQMNIIYANGFRAVHSASGGSGGKGLMSGGKGGGSGQTKYYSTWIGAIGEGFIPDLVVIYENQSSYTFTTAPSGRNITMMPGNSTQVAVSYIATNWPNDAFDYVHTAYLAFLDSQLDSSATIPFINFVPIGVLAATSPLNRYTAPNGSQYFLDADPAQCIYDFLTNSRYGAGFPAAYIDTTTLDTSADGYVPLVGDAALSTFCQAAGMAWSLVLNNTEPASSILDRWCKNLVTAPVWTGAILKFIPYCDVYLDRNDGWDAAAGIDKKYYQPNVTPIFDLDDDDYQQTAVGDDPLVITRIDVADVKNTVRLDYRDRGNQFNSSVSEAKDETAADLFGPRVDRMGAADEFTHGNYAGTSVNLQLQRNLSVRNKFSFKLGWQYCVLDPMDIVTLTDTTLGLNRFPVRIISIEEDEKGVLSIEAEEFPASSAASTLYAQQQNVPPDFATNVAPGAVNAPVIFEPTPQMLYSQGRSGPTIIIGASAGPAGVYDSNWGGCVVYASDDGVTYVQQGTIDGPSRTGVTTSSLPAYGGYNPDTINTLRVDLSESNGTLETVTSFQAASGLSLCALVDSSGGIELFCFTTATLVSSNVYDLTGLYRGFYGTKPCAHSSGDQFIRIDGNVLESALPTAFIGETISFKFQSFNIFNQAFQDLSSCAVYTYTPTGVSADPNTNPIAAALLGGSPVDLNPADGAFDLSVGGASDCSPSVFAVDLGAA